MIPLRVVDAYLYGDLPDPVPLPPAAMFTPAELRALPQFADTTASDADLTFACTYATEVLRLYLDRGVTFGRRRMRVLEHPVEGWLRLADAPVATMLIDDGAGGFPVDGSAVLAQAPGYLACPSTPPALDSLIWYASGYHPIPDLLQAVVADMTARRLAAVGYVGPAIQSVTVPDVGNITFAGPGAETGSNAVDQIVAPYAYVLASYRRPGA